MRIGVLALQGAFAEHIAAVRGMGEEAFEIRGLRDISDGLDGLILPGGESTAMKKLLHESGLFEPLKALIDGGLPVLGTCAGMILLAAEIDGGEQPCFGAMDITVKRNAYGRQLGSYACRESFAGKEIEMRFIRAPYVTEVRSGAEVLAVHEGRIVAVGQGSRLAVAFHPELTSDTAIYDHFFEMIG